MGTIRYDSLPIVIDGKCVLQNSQTYGGVGNYSVSYEWQEPDGVTQSGGRQAPEHRCVKHEITSAREGSGEM